MIDLKEFLKRHNEVQIQLLHLGILSKLIFLAGITGLLVGVVATAFSYCMSIATNFRIANPLILWLLPFGGVFIVWLYHRAGFRESRGTNLIISSVRSEEPLSFRIAPLIFISTVLTHLLGGSAGREGAALQLGGSLATSFGRWFHLNNKDCKLMTMCGMSAAFTTLFDMPLTATIFAMEFISVGIMHYAALVSYALASIVALQVSQFFGLSKEQFLLQVIPQFDFLLLLKVG